MGQGENTGNHNILLFIQFLLLYQKQYSRLTFILSTENAFILLKFRILLFWEELNYVPANVFSPLTSAEA